MVKIGNINLGEFPLLLAPMEDVSDPPFRSVCKEYGADLVYTEFISSEGLIRNASKSHKKLDIFEYERPIGVQLFGGDINNMVNSAEIATTVNPDIIDINYGCPVKAVACRGAGAALLQDIPKMVRMTKAIVDCTSIPVTVKTRLGWDDKTKNVVDVAEQLQDIGIQAITIHGRTRVQMYKGDADWTLIRKIKSNPRMRIPVFGNGDINSPQKALDYKMKYGVDGIMVGRAAIGAPWIFNQIRYYLANQELLPDPIVSERSKVCRDHLDFSIRWKGDKLGIFEMRRHYSNYFKGLPDFKSFRTRLVTSKTPQDIHAILDDINQTYSSEYDISY